MTKASDAYPWQLVLINEWPVDCTLSETHEYESEVTEFPVESGSVISDNIRLQPLVVRLECIVSNTPIGEIVNSNGSVFNTDALSDDDFVGPLNKLRSTVIYQRLMELRDKRDTLTVRTSRGVFDNMVIKSLTIPRDDKTGNAIKFSLTLQQVKIVNNERGKRAAVPNTGKGGVRTGTVSRMTLEGSRSTAVIDLGKVWYDPDIGAYRQRYYQRPSVFDDGGFLGPDPDEAFTDRSDNDLAFTYVKGPMLDGFMGTDAQCRAHMQSLIANSGHNPAAAERASIQGHEPFKSHPTSKDKTNLTGPNLGRITKIDGTPGVPTYNPPPARLGEGSVVPGSRFGGR